MVHPIEQLRYVARSTGADAAMLTQEAASALSMFAGDHHALLTGCKSLLTRQPAVGPLWWMCSRLLSDADTRGAVRQVMAELHHDPTVDELVDAISPSATVLLLGWPDTVIRAVARRPDLVVLVIDVDGQGHAAVRRLDRADVDAEAIDALHMAGAVEAADVVIVEAGALGESAALVEVGGFTAAAVARASNTPVWLVAAVGRALPEAYWQEIVLRIAEPDLPPFVADHEIVSISSFGRRFGPPVDCPTLPELLRPVR